MRGMLVGLLVVFATVLIAQPSTRVYTLTFNHDGVDTDSYAVDVDGVRATITPTCTGTGDTRSCTSPLTLTYGVTHTVKVYAVGLFGEGASLPFVCNLPKNPGNPRVVK